LILAENYVAIGRRVVMGRGCSRLRSGRDVYMYISLGEWDHEQTWHKCMSRWGLNPHEKSKNRVLYGNASWCQRFI
jgi:hypothetical protein